MINAVAAIRAYLLSVAEINTAVTQTEGLLEPRQNIFGIPPGIPGDAVKENVPQYTIALQQIRVTSDPYSPRERYRIRIRTYGPTAIDSSNLMRLVHNKAFYVGTPPQPVRNVTVANRWFLFAVDPTDEGPIVLNEEGQNFPVTVSSYDCTFDGFRG